MHGGALVSTLWFWWNTGSCLMHGVSDPARDNRVLFHHETQFCLYFYLFSHHIVYNWLLLSSLDSSPSVWIVSFSLLGSWSYQCLAAVLVTWCLSLIHILHLQCQLITSHCHVVSPYCKFTIAMLVYSVCATCIACIVSPPWRRKSPFVALSKVSLFSVFLKALF